ncbi:pimeloyl-ACP methyl ester carboxylesterase [Salirhabdus euzebyi]|uniref:Pimeloyl-ACP methyl ester carboxylesterase n=1 Tax=Salirhabdus euzebyi TaxID=394506 RepID=A0A841Q9G0_9BACI|nr:alpha/beta hydrolase [Salirhabdus euzebyi]MBB6455319.1 pimeloyl-ACP methyl ester carboxylesterase [Salirhabdus euzebyi]
MFVKAGGHLIHAVSFGNGEGKTPFVAHGGWTGSWELWEQPLEVLSQSRRCIAIDHLGSGESPIPKGTVITLDMLVENLRQVLDQLEIQECILAGESSGSKVVLQFALKYPNRVKGLVLVDGFGFAFPKEAIQMTIDQLEQDYHGYIDAFVDLCLPNGEAHIKRWGKNILLRASKEDAIELLKINATVDLTPQLKNIHVPTLIVHGQNDALVPVVTAEQIATEIPGAELVVIPDAGHVPTISHPIATTIEIKRFLSTISE